MNTSDKSAERHLLVTIRSQPERHERVQELLLELVDLVRSESGCLYYHLFQQAEDPNAFLLAAGWVNDEAVAAHPTHPAWSSWCCRSWPAPGRFSTPGA